MSAKLIVVDGKAYSSIEEMPPDIREKYELAMCLLGDADEEFIPSKFKSKKVLADQNRDGVPDMLANMVAANAVVDGMKIVFDGREFNRIEDLPPEARAHYEEAMRKLDANGNGIPDFVERRIAKPTNQTANISTTFGAEAPHHAAPLLVGPTITPESSSGWTLALAGLFGVLLCVASAAGVWYFFLR